MQQEDEQYAEGSRQNGAIDIAIVGMACRFPGAAHYDEYWQNLVSGRNCIREVPSDRWDWRRYFGDPRVEPNKTNVKWGGFIDDIDKFDPLFFGIAPNEAAFIDPQHRLFLETAWHAVEDAGYSIASLSGKAIGVYVGVSKNDYSELMRESRYEIAPYISTGTVHSILTNRVSFLFDLRGRSEAVDTACSSALVALHNAIRDIANGECEAAIVGGVNALITPTMFISHSRSGMLSPDGQCKTFSAGANGYVRSEGVGVLYIKPLDRAVQDGDHIHAVIKSTAINHGGRSNFLTSPTTEAQAAVVMKALRRGKIDPRTIDYVEAHGTGTPLGDPIEINGLKKAFAQLSQELPNGGSRKPHCALSAVKTNVGHLESAAGMAGIIKVVLAMKHRQIPAIRNFERRNPYIELDGSPFFIATEAVRWQPDDQPRRAGVSSFGMGGVNAHVVLEEPPVRHSDASAESGEHVVLLSARKGRLKPYAESFIDSLVRAKKDGDTARLSLRDIAFTSQTGRDVFEERLAVVAHSIDHLIATLESYVSGAPVATAKLFTGEARGQNDAGTVVSGVEPAELAAQWTHGAQVDWTAQYSGSAPRRVPLATYPFARKRCWFTDVASRVPSPVHAEPAAAPAEIGNAVTVLSRADFFIRDHVVQGRPMLPGVVHLELARAAAAKRGGPLQAQVLKDVYWIAPVVVEGDDIPVEIRLIAQQDGTHYELLQSATTHSKGSLVALPPGNRNPRALDLEAVRSRCAEGKSRAELYALLREHGLSYGSSFQSIERYVHNEREILAELKLPEEVQAGAANYVLHPSIMDGVFQAVTALSLIGLGQTDRQFVPFYLETAAILAPTAGHCFVYATVNDHVAPDGRLLSFDATLADADGNVLVDIRNLQKRPLVERQDAEPQTTTREHYYRPVWRRRELPTQAAPAAKTLVVFAHDDRTIESFRKHSGAASVVLVLSGPSYQRLKPGVIQIDPAQPADYERLLQELKDEDLAPARVAYLWGSNVGDDDVRGSLARTIYGVLHFTQAAFKARFRENVHLAYVHPPVQGLARSIHATIAGFARTLKYENPKFDYVTVGIDDANVDELARVVTAELHVAAETTALREVEYRDGQRYQRTIVRDSLSQHGQADAPAIRPGGVYIVSGGAGGLGAVFSRHFAEKHHATILWLGRSAMNTAIAKKIREIEEAGGKCEYYSADITDRDALAKVFPRIKSAHPEIHGVIHAAGVIEDAFILRKQPDSFARVIEPKILGAIHLDALTQDEPLDFFLVFSSIAALMPNQGQCDYASANSFLDGFVEARNALAADGKRSGVSVAVNWPLWAHGGMRVTPEEERHLLRVFGMKPLATADGLALFEAALTLARSRFPEIHQVIAIGGDREKIERSLGVDASAPVTAEAKAPDAPRGGLDHELKSIFASRLRIAAETIPGGKTIGELGVDSTTIVGVITDINRRFGADLKPTLLFDINTVDKLAAHLIEIGKDSVAIARWNRSLIDVERSDRDRRIFRRTFRTAEFYLRDHVVDGQYNMPGACYVEMARQAGDLLLGDGAVRRLLHNYWASPLSSPREDFTAQVELTPKGDHFAYEVVSFTPAGEKRLHAMGQIPTADVVADPEARIDLAQVRSRCDETQYPERIYEQIHGEGLMVGPTFEPMKQIFLNDAEALAELVLPEEIRGTDGDYVLNPALLTGAFQAALIGNRRSGDNSRRYIPIGMDELEVLAPIPAECFIYSRPRAANARNEEMRKFDVDVCRPDGVVVVRLKGFSIRALKEAAPAVEVRSTAAAEAPKTGTSVELVDAVQNLIKTKLAAPIGLPVDEIDAFVEFDRYGVTSIMVVELNQAFEDLLGPIPKTLFFEYRNVAELAEYFIENHGDVLRKLFAEKPKAPAVATPPVLVNVSVDSGDPLDEVHAYLRSLIARPIGLSVEEIDFHTGFDQYGVNSVMVVELNQIFEDIFGPLSKTLFFEYRSVDELARYFLDEHREKVLAVLPPKQKPVVAVVPERVSETVAQPQAPQIVVEERHDIAIVSAAGRFPGARNLAEFWDVLREGRDCITEIPAGRFHYEKYYDEDPERNGIYAKWGGFIDDVDRFDPAFFNIAPREAELIDPQERLLLEVVWEMLERAGYTRQRLHALSDRRVGVFVGALWQPYEAAGVEATLSGNVVGPSSLLYSIANRISYFFDLSGPSMAIDTACSSSLTALHLACQSIRDGESQFAIAAGVNLSLTVSKYLFLARNHFLSTDGRCRSYGAGGDGYVPGEGVCALLLKPLSKAIADGDTIQAVIKGSAINHGGRTNGYTVPNPRSQGNVIAQALQSAGVDPHTISYIEGHGTGTSLGDPVEIAGLEKALGLSKDGSRVCAIGSVKSNIGHLEAAAGIASVIKVLLQMQHGQIVPSLHAGELNPNIDFGRSLFRVQRELAPWPNDKRRCAGISSFGAGGSNAHVIVEQYEGPVAPSVAPQDRPALCVFSARSEERLFEMVRRFDESLRDTTHNIHEIAHTLQLGREAMRERLAIVANDVAELRAALADFLEQKPQQNNARRGRVTGRGLPADGTSWKDRSPIEVAEAWVQGREIDWTTFYEGRTYRFLPLPTYPFARERYWLDMAASEPPFVVNAEVAAPATVLHPLLHRNTSDLSEQRFSTTFNGQEFFLADHQVRTEDRGGVKVLPGVAYLELARAAIEQATAVRPESAVLELLNTIWTRPFLVTGNDEIHIALSAHDDQIDYEIYSRDNGQKIVHCQGRAVWNRQPAPARLDLQQIAGRMRSGQLDGDEIYGLFSRRGLALGPSFQPVTAIHLGDHELLAQLRLPKVVEERAGDYVLHPSLMDGALHGSLGMIDGWSGDDVPTRMPFALESLRVLSPCLSRMVAWMRYSPDSRPGDRVAKLDVDLCDEQGRVCVRIRGFASRPMKESTTAVVAEKESSSTLMTLAPVWDAVKPEVGALRPAAGERVAVVGGTEEQHRALREVAGAAEIIAMQTVDEIAASPKIDHLVWILPAAEARENIDEVIAAQEQGVLFGFRLVKALLRAGYGTRELAWTVITNATQQVAPDETIDAAHSSVHGLLGSMAKEHGNWKVRSIDLAGDSWPWGEMLRLRADERGDGWAWRNGQWYRRRLVPCALPEAGNGYKRGGVYVVIGGAGGVGEVFSEHLISRYDARVVWIGRRPLDEEIERKQQRAAARGGQRPLYIAADARNREDLDRARTEIKSRYGRIDGVIHSAIILSDKSLANMGEEQFRAALSTKVDTSVRLAEVFGREPLDFILYFSSLQSYLKAPGQSNYAAGCTFTDAFAEWQSASAPYPVKVMNWGYWGGVGIVAAAEYQQRMARLGWGSIEPAEGMAGLERLLRGPIAQVGMIRANGDEALRALGVATGETVWVAREAAPALCATLPEREPVVAGQESEQTLRSWEEQRIEFDAMLAKMLRAQLAQVPGVTAEYERWLEESRRIVAGLPGDADAAQLWAEWDAKKGRWEAEGLKAQVKLVETTLRSLVPIVRGQQRATEIMFPGSSLSLVEGVYKNNTVADYFNRVMANVVRWYAEERSEPSSQRTKLRLLELGAGTGGSSQGVLQKLDAYRERIEEYCYTDVSKVFLLHGEQAYGAGRDFLRYVVVDVEKGLQEQGLERGAYDVVLAANVLHATRRLRDTLRNAKSALKANGLLVLNEITDKSVFMHLTFGLLSGWWAYEDEELRMGGSPGLTPDAWKRVLEEEGFRNVSFPAHAAQGLGQQIIVAESDGIIRQKHAPAAQAPRRKLVEVVSTPAVEKIEDSGIREKIESWLADAVVALLKVKRDDVDPEAELSEFGFDSISLTGLTNYVNQAFALELMPTIFFEHPTVRAFGRYLVASHSERLAEKLGVRKTVAAATPRVVASASAPAAKRTELQEKVQEWLVETVGALLKVKREDADLDAELSEFGFDSISLTGLTNHVNQAFALELMPTIFFEHPTMRQFAGYLVAQHRERLATKFKVENVAAVVEPKRARVQVTEVVAVDNGAPEPIAIIGMSGRFPGADDLDAFWENLAAGKESVREIPLERWDWKLFGEEREDGTRGGARWGAFMDGVDQFDPLFFGISPREAERMDPQHRLTMMYGWKAFEDAGYGPKQLWGSRTGVFIGTTSTGYGELLLTHDGTGIEGYSATGLVPSVGPNRVSYLLNLHGPSEPIETACSSSLVAMHRAVRSLLAGECEMALAGGVNTLFPTMHISFNKAGMLSPDGKCKTFSSRADGYARGEGVGMVVLKKLSAAERDGDHIYGLIRGSSENHGGRAQSLTAPNPGAQAELIKDAYRRAGVSPATVSYIEAHGTGTPLGDPIEINGLKSAFHSLYEERGEQAETGYCGLGSVKTNIGHLELAAGVAGVIKVLLQLEHKTLVRSLHSEEVNPYIRLEGSPFYVVRENRPWKRLADGGPLRAGVSSFGFGGVNAHVVLEEYAAPAEVQRDATGPVVIVLSARDSERLRERARQLKEFIGRRGWTDRDLAGMAFTLQVGREAMDHRVAMIVGSMRELELKLADFIDGRSGIDGVHRGEVKRNSETLTLFRDDEELQEAVAKWIQRGKWSKLLELWVKGVEIEWEQLYGEDKPRRVSLPTYPFAKQRCWIDTPPSRNVAVRSAAAAVLHPLLHRNTSDLAEQRYSSTFAGDEFFLTDHQIRQGRVVQKVLPGVAYLEMARAAIRQAAPDRDASTIELRDTLWLKPVVVTEPTQISITLSANDDAIDYQIYSVDGDQETVHCQGHARFGAQPASPRVDLEHLRTQMTGERLDAAAVYATFAHMGLHYGPAQQGITAIHLGDRQLLAELRLPGGVESTEHEFVLHPSLLDSALQASLGLFVDLTDGPDKPSVPFGAESVLVLSPSTRAMVAWVRLGKNSKADDKAPELDIDLCDLQGNVCVRIRGLASRILDVADKTAQASTIRHRIPVKQSNAVEPTFDDAFYESLIADIVNHRVSVDEAAELE